jgi:hypothetical protein
MLGAGVMLVRLLTRQWHALRALAANGLPWLLIAWFVAVEIALRRSVPITLVRLIAYVVFSSFVMLSLQTEQELRTAAWMMGVAGVWVFLLGLVFLAFGLTPAVFTVFLPADNVFDGGGESSRFGPFGPNHSGLWMVIGITIILIMKRGLRWTALVGCMTAAIVATMCRTAWAATACSTATIVPCSCAAASWR